MRIKGMNPAIVVVSLCLALVMFFFAERLYFQRQVKEPLRRALLEQPEVVHVDVSRGKHEVEVGLNWVENLQETYYRIRDLAEEAGGSAFTIRVLDNGSPQLDTTYDEVHFAVYEALETGHFTRMQERIRSCLREMGLEDEDYRITLNDDAIFVQLRQGEHYLYRVLKRPGR